MSHKVEFMKTPATTAAVTRFHVAFAELPMIGERMGRAFGTVMTQLGNVAISPNGPAIACYEPTGDGFEVAAGFRVPPTFTAPAGLERLDLDEVDAAHITHIGPYSELSTAYEALQTQAKAADRAVAIDGPMWEEYWSMPGTPEAQLRTEIYWPLSPAS